MREKLQNIIKISVCGTGLLYIFLTVIDLTYFLSVLPTKNVRSVQKDDKWLKVSWDLLVNMALLCLFILQHSFLAASGISKKLKSLLESIGLEVVYRSIYIITTAAALQVLMNYWLSIPEVILWQLNLNYRPLWWLYVGIHSTAWILIYVGNICTDITDLIGIKQVRYSLSRYPRDPKQLKSEDLLRLYSHMRHPSFLAFALIFWVFPVMSLDRFLLASILTLYMSFTWNTDERDFSYQKHQYIRKYHELDRLRR